MITLTDAQLNAWLAQLFWPLTRLLGLMAAAPLLGNLRVPARTRIGLALIVATLAAPSVGGPPGIAPASADGMLVLARELMIGLAMGYAVRITFAAVEYAGELAGLQMGLGFAVFYDAQSAAHTGVLSQFMGLVATVVFVSINGHLLMLSVLLESFRTLPVATAALPDLRTLVAHGGQIFAAGLAIALPVVVVLLVVNMALGVLARAAPQLNVFAIGFPVTLGVGFAALAMTIPLMAPLTERLVLEAIALMQRIATVSRAI